MESHTRHDQHVTRILESVRMRAATRTMFNERYDQELSYTGEACWILVSGEKIQLRGFEMRLPGPFTQILQMAI